MSKGIYLPRKQRKAVSSTNVRITANRKIDEYLAELYIEEDLEDENMPEPEPRRKETRGIVFRLDRKDRDQEIQDACQIYNVSQKIGFEASCNNVGIPTYTMTYLMDQLASECTELSLRNHGIGSDGIVAVVDLLSGNHTVTTLDLSVNDIQDEGVIPVAKLMQRNRTITHLNISENNIGKKGIEAISNTLISNGSLRCLNLSRNNLTNKDIEYFTSVMQTEELVEVLDLSHNKFKGHTAGVHFAELIRANISLRELNLGWNYFGDNGTREISKDLAHNQNLTKLDLCWNEIKDLGAKDLADVLRLNSCLQELDLSNNRISDTGTERLAWGLEGNATLTNLRIGFNHMTAVGACYLMRSLLKNLNSALEILNLAEVGASNECESLFWNVKRKKPRFRVDDMRSSSGGRCEFVLKPLNTLDLVDTYLTKNNLIDQNEQEDE